MQLLIKCLKPRVIPSTRRKKIPFGMRLQLYLYRSCIKRLVKYYKRHAFSDCIVLSDASRISIIHEYRDYSFEAELKRLHMQMPDTMIDQSNSNSHISYNERKQHYGNCFQFEDVFVLEIAGKQVRIDHGHGRSFVSSFKGNLKGTDTESLFAKYSFTGSVHGNKNSMSDFVSSPSGSYGRKETTGENPTFRHVLDTNISRPYSPKKKAGGLFGKDPLFEEKSDISPLPASTYSPSIKTVEGVTIDESF